MSAAHSRADGLARRLEAATEALLLIVEVIEPEAWDRSPAPGVWSAGKEAEHVADAAILHQWVVRTSIGEHAGPRPTIERATMTSSSPRSEVIDRIRAEAVTGMTLLYRLSEDQLDVPVKPPRSTDERVAGYIERVMIKHVRTHEAGLRVKLRRR